MKKNIRRFLSCLLIAVLFCEMQVYAFSDSLLNENDLSGYIDETFVEDTFSFMDDFGQSITILTKVNDKVSMAKVYVDGVLTQKTVYNMAENKSYSEAVIVGGSYETVDEMNGIDSVTQFISSDKINGDAVIGEEENYEDSEELSSESSEGDAANTREDESRLPEESRDIFQESVINIHAFKSSENLISGNEVGFIPNTPLEEVPDVVSDFEKLEVYGADTFLQEDYSEQPSINIESGSNSNSITPLAAYYEPGSNKGLTISPYGDGYYRLHRISVYLPQTTYFDVYRTYTSKYLGLTNSWTWTTGTTMSAIIAVLTGAAKAGLKGAIFGILGWTAQQVLSYTQSVDLETYRHDCKYKIRYGLAGNNSYYNPSRVIDYWRTYNRTNGLEEYIEKQFVSGTAGSLTFFTEQAQANYERYQFSDIVDHWAKDDIKHAYTARWVDGTSTYLFSPNNSSNRAMAATVLYRMAGSPSTSYSSFNDVPTSAYYAKAVGWASKNGIVNGVSNTSFAPNNDVTKQDFVVMMYRYAQYAGKSTTASGNLNNFSDSSRACSIMTKCTRNGKVT